MTASLANSASGALLPDVASLLAAIAETCPAAAARAERTLIACCAPWLEQRRRGLPLAPSRLTPGGHPLEFSLRASADEVNFTAEPGLPQAAVADKWRFVRTLVGDAALGAYPPVPALVAEPGQRFGCWLSTRHRRERTDYKVYQEVTPAARDAVRRDLLRQVPALGRADGLIPMLVGVVPGVISIAEYYCRMADPDPGRLHMLLAGAGLAPHLPLVVDYVAYLAAMPPSDIWQRLRLGISYSVSAEGAPGVTLFAHGRQLFPSNGDARRRVLGLARQIGRPMPAYDRITRPFERIEPAGMVHGMVGLKIREPDGVECAVGLRPFA